MAAAKKSNFTYILRCADGTLYTGWTNDIAKRIEAHNSGQGAKYTKPKTRRPVTLVYLEAFATKEEAMSREFHLKQLARDGKEELLKKAVNKKRMQNQIRKVNESLMADKVK